MTKITRGSIFLLCAILGIALLIGAVCSFAYSPYSTEPVEAAETNYSSPAHDAIGQDNITTMSGRVYISCDNTYISSVSISASTISTEPYDRYPSAYVVYNWTGRFTINLRSGYTWIGTSFTGTFAWGSGYSGSESSALTSALNASGRTCSISRSGNTFTVTRGVSTSEECGGLGDNGAWIAGVLKINNINNYIGYSITARAENSGSDKVQIDKTSDGYIFNSGTQHTFTYTSYDNYYISSVTINNAKAPILESAPAEFLPTTGCSYKCYRNGAQVVVIVTNLTQGTTIRGVCSSLWSVTSNKASIVIQEDETLMNRTNYFVKEALIVAQFSRNQNLCIIFDGVTARLKGDYSTGTISLPSGGEAKYTFNIYNNFVAISLTFPNGPHTVALDYYVGIANNINTSFDAGHSGNVEIFIDSAGVYNLVVTPNGDDYVNSLTFDNVMVDITYYKAEIYGVGAAKTVTYVVKDNTNVFLLQLDTLYDDINVTFNLSSLKPDYEVPPAIVGGGNVGVSGTVVSAGLGGEARIVGTDSSSESGEVVTVMAVAYSGFRFVGWVNANDETEILSNSTSATFDKDAVDGMVLKALFEPTNSNNSGNSNGNLDDPINSADIL